MNLTMKLFIAFLLCFSVLAGCSNNDKDQKEIETTSVDKKVKQNSGKDAGDKKKNKDNEDDGSTPTTSNPSKQAKDQVKLKLGDTGTIDSNIGKFEVTFNSVKSTKEAINGEEPYGLYIITELTIKNVGNTPVKAEDALEGMELYSNIQQSGSSDYSKSVGGVKAIEGELKPGQTMSGEALFDVAEADTYYLSDGRALAEAGTQNKVIWSFKPSDIKK